MEFCLASSAEYIPSRVVSGERAVPCGDCLSVTCGFIMTSRAPAKLASRACPQRRLWWRLYRRQSCAGHVQLQRAAILTDTCSATIGGNCRPITVVAWHRCHGNSLLKQQQQHWYHTGCSLLFIITPKKHVKSNNTDSKRKADAWKMQNRLGA